MTGLPAQPLEFTDFSGGITENILQGDPRRYAVADNFLITIDKKLVVRPGFIPKDSVNYILPTGNQRVNGLYTFINESILMSQSARDIFAPDASGNWLAVKGPSGNSAMSGGDLYSQNTYAEFQRQVYMVNDGTKSQNGIATSRLYRDTTNTWVANTAGLPRAYVQGNYTDSILLSTCLQLANNLRSSMVSHFNDARFKVYTATTHDIGDTINLHVNLDKYSLCFFVAQTFISGTDAEIPSVIPTPAANATDLASLFVLVAALNNAITHHTADAVKDSTLNTNSSPAPFYHPDRQIDPLGDLVTSTPRGPYALLANNATPTTIAQAAAMLDDVVQKWYWHRFSMFTHSPFNDFNQMNRYGSGLTKIGTIKQGNSYATITPDLADVYAYVNNVKYMFNSHALNSDVSGGGNIPHKQPDNYLFSGNFALQCGLPDCSDFDSMAVMIYWLRNSWFQHTRDSAVASHRRISFTATQNSTSLTSVVLTATSAAFTIPVGSYVFSGMISGAITGPFFEWLAGSAQTSNTFLGNGFVAKVLASGSGTATLDRQSRNSGSGNIGQVSKAWYHGPLVAGATFDYLDTTTAVSQTADFLTTAPTVIGGTDYKSWLTLVNEMFFCLTNHVQYQGVHFQINYSPSIEWPAIQNNVPYKPFFIPSVASYAYAFFFSQKYTVEQNGIQYLVQGNPVLSDSITSGISYPVGTAIASQNTALYNSAATTSQRTNKLTNLPVLTNDSLTNYDTANINLNIYRTTDGGNTYFLLAQVPNGTTSYNDITNDTLANPGSTSLSVNQPIYTAGGVVGSDQPPQAKFIHILAGTVYYGGITDSGQYFPQRIRQALQYAPEWAPATFFDDMDDEITGLSSTRTNLIVFCKNSIYRESGGFNTLGQGALTHERISDTLGCKNARSIVRTEIGVFFAGNDGFYYTDGYQIINITLELKKTYESFVQTDDQVRSIVGNYDKLTRRIWWSMKTSPTDTDNSVFYIFYLDYGVKPSGTFTTASNFPYLRPASHVFQQGIMYVGHESGFILKSDVNTKTDARTVVGVTAANWRTTYLPYNFTSIGVDVGSTFKRKWLTKVHVVGNNTGNAAVQMNVIRDLNADLKGIKPISLINYTDNITWSTPICIWGDATQVWNNLGKMDLWRRFPATTLRADFVQISYVPGKVAVYASSVNYPFGANAVTDNAAKTATIQTPSGYTSIVWPNDVIDYSIAFQYDNYTLEYPITALDVTGKIITYTDASNTSLNAPAGVPWVIRGIKKEQRPTITSFVVHYAYLGDETQAYPGKVSNMGAGNGGENPS